MSVANQATTAADGANRPPPTARRRPILTRLPITSPLVLLATLATNLLALALPLVVLQVYDRIIPNASLATLQVLVLGMLTALVLDLLVKLARAYLTGWRGAQFEHEKGRTVLDRLLNARLDAVEGVPAGVHLDRMNSIERLRDFYASQASLSLIDTPFVLIFLALMGLIAGWLLLVPITLLLIAVGLAYWVGERLRAATQDRALWDDRRYNFIIEALSGIHSIKALAMERLLKRRYSRLMSNNALTGYRVAFLSGMAQSIGAVFSQLTMAAVAGVGCVMVIRGDLTVGGLAACTLLAGRTVQPVLRFMTLWARFQAVRLAEAKLAEIDTLPIERHGEAVLDRFERLTLSEGAFRFSDNSPPVLHQVDFELKSGEIVGITGGNGVGKTTLLHIMMGSLTATSGDVLLNGLPPEDYSAHSLSQKIAFLPQRPVLFSGTVLENITMFKTDEHLETALSLANDLGLDEVFARMPDGYDTRVGDVASSTLPSGVAQRITIARALVRRPELILFDEANTSLDGRSDAKLRDVLDRARDHAAMVLVSFRPSLLRLADRRYILTGGGLQRQVPTDRPVVAATGVPE